jgi:hypothetical protein
VKVERKTDVNWIQYDFIGLGSLLEENFVISFFQRVLELQSFRLKGLNV